MERIKLLKEKRMLIVVIIALFLFFLALGILIFKIKKLNNSPSPVNEEKIMEEIIDSLTAPATNTPSVPKEVMESLSATLEEKTPEVPEDIINSLTAPSK